MTVGWLLYATVLGCLFGVAALAAQSAFAASRKPTRWAWCVSLAASLAVPLGVYLVPAPLPSPIAMLLPSLPISAVGSDDPAKAPRFLTLVESAFPYLWGLASATLLAWLGWNHYELRRARMAWPAVRLHGVEVQESPTTGPAVVGVLRGWITVPRWIHELDRDLQQLAVLHEREHQQQRDPALLWAGWLACAAVPWNPSLWWQLRRLRLAIEVDCDRRVLRGGTSIVRYGELLLEVGRRMTTRPRTAVALFETSSFLERRIRAMTSPATRGMVRALAAIGVVVVVVAFAFELPPPNGPSKSDGSIHRGPEADFPALVTAPSDTPPSFVFTPYTVKPRCIEGCDVDSLMRFMQEANAPASCGVTIGILLDTTGRVVATDILRGSVPPCEEAARDWAMTTRWTPAENNGEPVDVWIAQPISITPDQQVESGS